MKFKQKGIMDGYNKKTKVEEFNGFQKTEEIPVKKKTSFAEKRKKVVSGRINKAY